MSAAFEQLAVEAEKAVKDLGIPSCPAILGKITRESAAPEPDFRRIGQWISEDVSLAAAMLKTVNSPFYGLQRKAESVHQALMYLGLRTVSLIVTGLMLRQALGGTASPALVAFWERSAQTAAASARAAQETRIVDRDLAYTFALFRDCGVPIIAKKYAEYERLLAVEASEDSKKMLALEVEGYGVHHALVGSELARGWGLGIDMCEAISHHHDYPISVNDRANAGRSSLRLVAIGWVADQVAAPEFAPLDPPVGVEFVLETLKMDVTELGRLITRLKTA
jgi:HD-like signal output (HDOD) protein